MSRRCAAVEVLKIAVRNLYECFVEALANEKAYADAERRSYKQIADVLGLKQQMENLDLEAMDEFVEKCRKHFPILAGQRRKVKGVTR